MPNNCITIEAEIYGIIPKAHMDAWENAPPENIFNKPNNPSEVWSWSLCNSEGSIPGKIVDILKRTQYMNPVIYFDELDKVSNTPKGEEIINLLILLYCLTILKNF